MIKITIDGIIHEVGMTGSLLTICSDLTSMLAHMHAMLYSKDPKTAEEFKRTIQRAVADENGPVWSLLFLPAIENRAPTAEEKERELVQFLRLMTNFMK